MVVADAFQQAVVQPFQLLRGCMGVGLVVVDGGADRGRPPFPSIIHSQQK